jgi:hypothetical protein
VPHLSSASLFEEGEAAGEELHLLVLWHTEPAPSKAKRGSVGSDAAAAAAVAAAAADAGAGKQLVECRGMTSLVRIPVRLRMAKGDFQCPLNMGLVRSRGHAVATAPPAVLDE